MKNVKEEIVRMGGDLKVIAFANEAGIGVKAAVWFDKEIDYDFAGTQAKVAEAVRAAIVKALHFSEDAPTVVRQPKRRATTRKAKS